MLTKVLLKKPSEQHDAARPVGQQRPTEERYRLRVDELLKRSFKTNEAALTAGQVIKKTFPIVMVTVVDADSGAVEFVTA
jgi:hypothetical protein